MMGILRHFIFSGLFTCSLCGGRAAEVGCICSQCDRDLPRITTACNICGIPLTSAGICGACLGRQHRVDIIISAFCYSYPLRQLIRQGKYRGEIRVMNSLALGLAEKVLSMAHELPDVMIPVPLHRWRIFSRGYNQSLEICRQLSRRLDIPYESGVVYRHRSTRPMFDLNPAERRRNINGSFRLNKPINHYSVAIVDDVVTSAATVEELARLLKLAGVRHVQVWSLARAY